MLVPAFIAQAELAKSAIEPLSTALGATLATVLMLAFALAWRRLAAKSEAAHLQRTATLEAQVAAMALATAKTDYVSREQHNNLAQSIRDDIKKTDLDVREIKTRLIAMEKK